ncbi:MAG: anaerobic ribonucleoside-triphosphate reductase activating protein [Heliobacteriaceae bacterium]|jgi:pyruvate formate lyase activating enzyme|nr:anaerobic ribonucleoside-triphosphate reductase activating protein [Heliobacteriaceae bacterium]
MSFSIGGLQRSSLLDYPGKISAIIFTLGCNFRCGYCHNPELTTLSAPKISTQECFEFLKTRQGKLDGVVITGGEPCLQSGLIDFIREIKSFGFLVKLDTNGSFPDVIEELIEKKLIDYIAMDVKAPLYKYPLIVNSPVDTEKIKQSIRLILNSGIDYEFRTTAVKSQLSFKDFEQTGKLIKGAKKYYLQKFEPSKILDKALMSEKTYSNEEFEYIRQKLLRQIERIGIR